MAEYLIEEQFDVLRRISERGLALSHSRDTAFVDLFQHLLDEIERTHNWYKQDINDQRE